MARIGAGPQRSAFLSSFFTLVGCHGAHVTAGLMWLGTMMAQIWAKGFREHIVRRMLCLTIFWHALDIIWVGHLHHRLSDRDIAMSDVKRTAERRARRAARQLAQRNDRYVIGLGLALILTGVSFWVASTSALWGPGIAVGLVVLAVAQMGVHLVFFLHITSGPDNTNNVLALAFGVLIVGLVMIGTIWIMAHLAANMGPSAEITNLQMQR